MPLGKVKFKSLINSDLSLNVNKGMMTWERLRDLKSMEQDTRSELLRWEEGNIGSYISTNVIQYCHAKALLIW